MQPPANRLLTLRSGIEGDVAAMFELDRLCFDASFRFTRITMRRYVLHPRAISIVACEGAVLIGFTIAQLEAETAYLVTLDVRPSHRRMGIARRLLHEIERAAQDAGASYLSLHVWSENGAAQQLYASVGFQTTGISGGYYGTGKDAVEYCKAL